MVEEGKILLKRSDVSGKTPTAEQLDYGELAVNYADGSEALFFKNNKDNLIQFDPLQKEDVLQIGSNNLSDEQKKSVRESIGLGNVDNISLVKYTEARSDNLITNGNGNMGNNYNFPGLEFDPLVVNNNAGSFKAVGPTQINCTEKISIELNSIYNISVDLNMDNPSSRRSIYGYTNYYDIDDNIIYSWNVKYIPNTLTTLAKDLKPGDTTVYLEDVSNFIATESSSKQGLIFWNYKNSLGYQYKPETYSRNVYFDLWTATDDSFKDESANTITLDKPWPYATISAGTKLSQRDDEGTYDYFLNQSLYNISGWTHYSINKRIVPRAGTQKISLGFLLNWFGKSGTDQMWLANVHMINLSKTEIDSAMSDTSDNPISNKTVKAYIDKLISELKTSNGLK